jgi:hypothetical protein
MIWFLDEVYNIYAQSSFLWNTEINQDIIRNCALFSMIVYSIVAFVVSMYFFRVSYKLYLVYHDLRIKEKSKN